MNYYWKRATVSLVTIFLLVGFSPLLALSQQALFISKNADFSTEDRAFSENDILYVKVVAPHIDYADLDKNKFRLKPDEGGNDIEKSLTNNLNGTYTTSVDLSVVDKREDDWEVRIELEDENDHEFKRRVDISIGDGEGRDEDDFDDDEIEFTGRIDSLGSSGINVDGIFFIVNESTLVVDDDDNPISFGDLSIGQIVEIRGDRRNDGTLVATKIELEDDFFDDDEVEFTGVIDSLSTSLLVVAGVTFHVDDNTVILDENNLPIILSDLFVGEVVEIRGDRRADGSLVATDIKVEDDIIGDDEVEFTGRIDRVSESEIVVNEVAFLVGANTVVLDNNNRSIDFSTLFVGQLVEIKGNRRADGSLVAIRIKLEDRGDDEVELTGEIEQIDQQSLVVSGLTFLVNEATIFLDNDNQPISFEDLSIGLIVEIRADIQADGSLLASDIKIEDRLEDEVEVRGIVDTVGDSSLVLLGREFIVLNTTSIQDENDQAIPLSSIFTGDIVEVKANLLPGGSLIALRIEVEDDDPFRVRVQGPVDQVGADTLTIAGIDVLITSTTTVEDQAGNPGTLDDLAEGQTLDVDAEGQVAGIPVATHIRIKRVARMTGSIANVTLGTLEIAGTTIIVEANTLILSFDDQPLALSALSMGQFASVRAEYLGKELKATTIEILEDGFISSVNISDESGLPRQFMLDQNYPNPFNPVTTISFEILGSQSANVTLVIYNILGQSVRTLVSGELQSGSYQIQWNGLDDYQQLLSSGMYLYQLKVDNLTQTKSMILLK